MVAEPGRGRHQGLRAQARDQRRRLSRRGAGQEPAAQRSATATTSTTRSRPASRSRRRSRPRSSITGIDKQKVGQVAAEIRAVPQAGALQGQGREVRRRIHLPQGRQEEVGRAMATEHHESAASPASAAPSARRAARPRRGSRVFRSSKHIYAQVIDDAGGQTLAAASSLDKDLREKLKTGADKAAADRGRQADRRARDRRPASRTWSSTAAAISITAASRRSPTPPARAA